MLMITAMPNLPKVVVEWPVILFPVRDVQGSNHGS